MDSSPYLQRFKQCGQNVRIHPSAYIEHPEVLEVGDNVTIHAGFNLIGKPAIAHIGSNVTFHPNCYLNGSPGRLWIDDHVEFYTGVYMGLETGNRVLSKSDTIAISLPTESYTAGEA